MVWNSLVEDCLSPRGETQADQRATLTTHALVITAAFARRATHARSAAGTAH
jgi:hypothetical protein